MREFKSLEFNHKISEKNQATLHKELDFLRAHLSLVEFRVVCNRRSYLGFFNNFVPHVIHPCHDFGLHHINLHQSHFIDIDQQKIDDVDFHYY